jgi:hypothetical protein
MAPRSIYFPLLDYLGVGEKVKLINKIKELGSIGHYLNPFKDMAHDPIYLLQETMGYSQEQRKNSFIERRKTEKTGRSRLRPHHKLELLKVLLRLDLVGDILAPVEEMGQCPIY